MRYDKEQLRKSLTVDDIKNLLYKLGAANIIDDSLSKGQLITNTICHGGEKMKLYYYTDKQVFHCYTDCSCNFNIFDLVIKIYRRKGTELNLPSAIEWVAINSGKGFGINRGWGTNTSSSILEEDWKYLNKLTSRKKRPPIETKKHNEYVLEVFNKYHHPSFLEDNVSHEAMDVFEIMYYQRANRIVIPHRHPIDGSLMGIRGRALNDWEIDDGKKYLPLIIQEEMYNFPSFAQLYGLWQNRETIKRLKKAALFEAEKSVLQCESYYGRNNNFALATMGKNISQNQVDMLLDLGIEEILICYDKEFHQAGTIMEQNYKEIIAETARKFSPYVRTYVVWDTIDAIGFKDSPSDYGKEVLNQLLALKQEVFNLNE